jgi:hypothetical protein
MVAMPSPTSSIDMVPFQSLPKILPIPVVFGSALLHTALELHNHGMRQRCGGCATPLPRHARAVACLCLVARAGVGGSTWPSTVRAQQPTARSVSQLSAAFGLQQVDVIVTSVLQGVHNCSEECPQNILAKRFPTNPSVCLPVTSKANFLLWPKILAPPTRLYCR